MVGVSTFSGYSSNESSMLSLAVVDNDVSEPGTEVTLVWGEEGGGSAKPVVERHVQTEIRAIVSPAPYAEVVRASYRPKQLEPVRITEQPDRRAREEPHVTELDRDGLVWMYTQMLRIREFEERVKRTFLDHPGVIRGHTHLADGAEASIVGSIATLGPDDQFFATYRCHGYPLARGTDVEGDDGRDLRPQGRALQGHRRLDAPHRRLERLPRHLGDRRRPGSRTRPGAAWAAQIRKQGQVVLCFFGDGASKQGAFAETLNIASLWKLPIVFVMENNGYNVHTRTEQEDANRANGEDLSVKAKAYSMPGVTIDGRDPVAVYETVGAAVARARAGDGPTLVESQMYRLSAHGNIIAPPGVPAPLPRARGDREVRRPGGVRGRAARATPCPRFRGRLVADGTLSADEADTLAAAVRDEMQAAVDFGLESPFPDVESALEYTYA